MQKEIFPKLKIETNKTEETKKCESIFEYAKEELNYIVSSTNVLNPLVEKHIDILEKSNIEKIQKELNYGENLVISVDLMGFGEAVQFRLIKSILNKVVPRATCYIEERSIDENDNNKGINLFPEYKNYIPADERKLCINDSNGSYQFWKKHRGSIEAGIWVIDDIEYDPLKDNNIFPMQLIKPFNIPSFSEKNKEITKQILKIKATEKVVTFGSMIDFATYQFDLIKECLKKKFKIILTPRLINDAEGYQERLGKSFPDKTIAFLSELKNDEQKNYDILIADTMGQLNLFYSISDIAI
ncbi:hypothetical protein KKC04_03615, partial [Patescibacteria group bacterium]|nr:hypothetical protein [Patescibacteria group bacterium]